MPIYEYRCSDCGFEKEFLRKVSDPQLTDCPKCGKSTLTKKLSAAGFQLKGSGWYATDFKGAAKSSTGGTESSAGDSSTAEASKPAAACPGGSCACH
jgi:putative FmdB family regulatory protein